MYRYLAAALVAWVALSVGVLAQAPTLPGFPPGVFQNRAAMDGGGGFTPTCAQSTTALAALATAGVTGTPDKTNYDAFVCGLVTDTDFGSLDAFYFWLAPTRAAALINLVNPGTYDGTEIGTPASWTSGGGYTGDGATFAFNSNFNPFSASSPKYGAHSASLGVCSLSNSALGAGFRALGAANVANTWLDLAYFGNTSYSVNASGKTVAAATNQGLWIMTRTAASGANASALYRNGNTIPIDTDTAADSGFFPRSPFYFFADDAAGVANNFSSLQMAAGFVGNGLGVNFAASSAATGRIYARIKTFLNAYSITACD